MKQTQTPFLCNLYWVGLASSLVLFTRLLRLEGWQTISHASVSGYCVSTLARTPWELFCPGTNPRRQASCQKVLFSSGHCWQSCPMKGCDTNSASHLGSLSWHLEVCGDVGAGAREERKYACCLYSQNGTAIVLACLQLYTSVSGISATWPYPCQSHGGGHFQACVNNAQNLFTTLKQWSVGGKATIFVLPHNRIIIVAAF